MYIQLSMCVAGFEPYTYLPHGFGQKTKHQISNFSKNFLGIKKARPSTGKRAHISDTFIEMGKKIEAYDFL